MWPRKQVCANCHFWVKQAHGDGLPGGHATLEIGEANRKAALRGDYSWLADHYSLGCHKSVWDEGHNFDPTRRHEVVSKVNRRNKCYFWQHQPGMLLPAAVALESREAAQRETGVARKWARVGLWLTLFALLLNAYLKVAESRKWPPFN
jgi:hypothetical protein